MGRFGWRFNGARGGATCALGIVWGSPIYGVLMSTHGPRMVMGVDLSMTLTHRECIMTKFCEPVESTFDATLDRAFFDGKPGLSLEAKAVLEALFFEQQVGEIDLVSEEGF